MGGGTRGEAFHCGWQTSQLSETVQLFGLGVQGMPFMQSTNAPPWVEPPQVCGGVPLTRVQQSTHCVFM